jgi:YHS domain-containing protein
VKSPRILALLALGAALAAFRLPAIAQDAQKAAVCPVSGRAVSAAAPSFHVNGQSVGFCCENCPKAFLADPEKYTAKMTLKCPVMTANAVKPAKNLRMAVNNGYVYTCCAGCPQAFLKTPEKFIAELKDPVSGKPFKLTAGAPHTTYKGAHFYFASADNKAAFDAAPDRYAKVLGS